MSCGALPASHRSGNRRGSAKWRHAGGKDDGGSGNSGGGKGDHDGSSDRSPFMPRNRRWETVGNSGGCETASSGGAGTKKGAGGEVGGLSLAKEEAFTRLFSVTPVKVSAGLSVGRLYVKWQRQEALGASPTSRHVALPSGATATGAGEAAGAASGPVAAVLAVLDGGQIPPHGKGSLYVRPLLIGTGPILGLAPAPEYTFLIYVSPVGNCFKVLKAQLEAKRRGYSDVLYLDAVSNTFVEE
eukprot:jgi/Mesen1/2202/ME000152S01294